MLMVDSTVWIDYFNGVVDWRTDYLDTHVTLTPILVGDLILAEVLQGFRRDAEFEKARSALSKFQQVQMVNPLLALQSARNDRFLRSNGVTVRKTIDSLIATYCIETGLLLLHNDGDFDGYEHHLGLKVVQA